MIVAVKLPKELGTRVKTPRFGGLTSSPLINVSVHDVVALVYVTSKDVGTGADAPAAPEHATVRSVRFDLRVADGNRLSADQDAWSSKCVEYGNGRVRADGHRRSDKGDGRLG